MIAFTLFGCTTVEDTTDDNSIKIENSDQANQTIDDVSTDLSGLSQALGEIDSELGEE